MNADRLRLPWHALLCLVAVLAAQGCVSAELPTPLDEPPIRDDSERPPDPSTDPDASLPDQGSPDMPVDLDMPETPDMPSPPDMPNPPDMTPVPDMPAGCALPPACTFGVQECVGAQIRTCTRDANMCPTWGPTQSCPNGFMCGNNSCQPNAPACVDNDGDGRGNNCAAGPDCDDNDRTRYPGAPELCDNRDNDCNNLVDDGVTGVGDPCSAGQGACLTNGSRVCDSQGNLACDATPRAGSPETCDGVDNDCDGATDEDNVCAGGTGVCANDTFNEPNDSLAAARPLPFNTPVFGATCSADKDFFTLSNLTAGQSTRINLAFDDNVSDLDLILYRNGTQLNSSTTSSDHEKLTFTPQAGSTYAIEIRPYSGNANYYRVTTMPNASLACASDDAFEPNDNRAQAAFLIRGGTPSASASTVLDAYSCDGNDDWYDLGNVPAGQRFWAEIEDAGCTFCPDFDLELLWYNPATGTTVSKDVSAGSADDERVEYTPTAADAGRYYLRVYNFGDNDTYTVKWNIYP